jgi:hypothetical protein
MATSGAKDTYIRDVVRSKAILQFPELAPITDQKYKITVELKNDLWEVVIIPRSTDIVGGGGKCIFSKDGSLLKTEGYQ